MSFYANGEINYLKPALLNDRIEIEALLEKLAGAQAFFKTLVERNREEFNDA